MEITFNLDSFMDFSSCAHFPAFCAYAYALQRAPYWHARLIINGWDALCPGTALEVTNLMFNALNLSQAISQEAFVTNKDIPCNK